MSKLNRILWSGLVLGIAACGDNVTVTQPPEPPTPGIASVAVAPDGATLNTGGTLQMSAAVSLETGATGTPTIAWTSSNPAIATVSASGLVTANATATGSVGITATATLGTSVKSGVATVNVVSAPTCAISGVTVSPNAADLVIGQTLAVAANVSGTNCTPAQLGVTYASSNTAVATVSTAGLVTAAGAGSATITATSSTDGSKKAALSVTVTAPVPAAVSIQSITYGALPVPVDLTNVSGQVEVSLNVDPGSAPTITKAQVLIGGLVVAEQCYAATCGASPAQASALAPQLAVSTLVLSTNTRQLRKVGSLYIPVVFNGPSAFSARVYTATSSTPASSNSVPVVMQNKDAEIGGPNTLAPVSTTPSFTNSNPATGTVWYKGNVQFTGGNYVSFFPVTPSITWGTTCGTSGNAVSGTPTTGITFNGTATCGSSQEGGVTISGYTVTAGTAPAADVIYIAATGYEQVGTAYSINGDNRYNLLSGGSYTSPAAVFIDNKAPTPSVWNEIGYLNGCSAAVLEGCWVNAPYAFATDLVSVDGGTGVSAENFFSGWTGTGTVSDPYVCGGSAVVTGNDFADNATKNVYTVCAQLVDNLGNTSGALPGPNPFSVDKIAPSFVFAGTYNDSASLGTHRDVFNAVPAQTMDYKVIDENSGIDQNVGAKLTFRYLVNNGTLVGDSTVSCTAPSMVLTAPAGAGVPRQLAATFAPDASCARDGYYYYNAWGEDRAGNKSVVVAKRFGYDDQTPVIDAVNLQPLYGGSLPVNVTAFASELAGADLENGQLGLTYLANGGTDYYTIMYPASLFPVFGAPYDNVLYLRTPVTGAVFSLAGQYVLGAFIDTPATATAGSAIDSIKVVVKNVYGTSSTTSATPVPAIFKDATKVPPAVTNTVWTAPVGISAPTLAVVGTNCTLTYGTPTNGPVILGTVVAALQSGASPSFTEETTQLWTGTPALISDNGVTRQYRITFTAATCVNINQVIALKADTNGILHGLKLF